MRARCLFLLLITCAVVAVEHIPLTEAAQTSSPINRLWLDRVVAWNKRTLTEAYRAVGTHDDAWNQEVEQLLDEWALRFATQKGAMPTEDVAALAARLLDERRCTDPLVIYIAARSFAEANNAERASETYLRAEAALRNSPYPAARRSPATAHLIRICCESDPPDLPTARAALERLATFTEQSWDDGDYDGLERLMASLLPSKFTVPEINQAWLDHLQAIAGRHAETWTGQYLLGWVAMQRGWSARGNGWGSTVAEASWKVFAEELAIAETHFTKAWTMDPTIPEAPSQMITIAAAVKTKDDERTWFDRAIAAEFDYPSAYTDYLWILAPRWGGTYQAMLAFARECGATNRYDTAIPFKIVDIMRDVGTDAIQMKHPEEIDRMFADQALWADVKAHLMHITTDPSFAGGATWFRSQLVALAWQFGERDLAITEARALGPQLNIWALRQFGLNADLVHEAIAAQDVKEHADF